MGLRVQLIVGCFPELCSFQFSVALVLVGLRKKFTNNFVFPTRVCSAGFNKANITGKSRYNNNNDNNNNNNKKTKQ